MRIEYMNVAFSDCMNDVTHGILTSDFNLGILISPAIKEEFSDRIVSLVTRKRCLPAINYLNLRA